MARTQKDREAKVSRHRHLSWLLPLFVITVAFSALYIVFLGEFGSAIYTRAAPPAPKLDTVAYDARLAALAHLASTTPFSSTDSTSSPRAATSSTSLWPVHAVYPNPGAILPFKRVVAYYGNFYAKGMGVLGQYPPQDMLARLTAVCATWAAADPTTPVVPAIDYIAVVAQASAGADGKYIARMPDSQIDQALALAKEVHGIVVLDVQVGLSDLPTELPLLEKYLAMPQVHLAIDPEFAMHNGKKPGRVIGSMDASDVNYAANYLASLVRAHNLPPKILVVHRFTDAMVTNVPRIKPLPEVQIVMDMDGWGTQSRKRNTYRAEVYSEPVQFAGFKLFYKNDLLPPSAGMLTPAEVLGLTPSPSFIQYQ